MIRSISTKDFELNLLIFIKVSDNIINMKILLMFIVAGIIGFVLIMVFSFVLTFINSEYTTYIDTFFFSNFFTLIIACIVIGFPFSFIYYQNKNIK